MPEAAYSSSSSSDDDDDDDDAEDDEERDLEFDESLLFGGGGTDRSRPWGWCCGAHWFPVDPRRAWSLLLIMVCGLVMFVLGCVFALVTLALAGACVMLVLLLGFTLEMRGYGSFKRRLRETRLRQRRLHDLQQMTPQQRQKMLERAQSRGHSANDLRTQWLISTDDWRLLFPLPPSSSSSSSSAVQNAPAI